MAGRHGLTASFLQSLAEASFSNDRFLNWDYDRFGDADSVSKELQAGISDLIYNSVGGPQLRTCN